MNNQGMIGNQNAPLPSFQPIGGPSLQMQNMPSGSLESRSSSVPLIPNYDGYNHSNFTSISQTPVPSECDDFSNPNNILDMLNEPSSSSNRPSIKLEDSEPSIADILDQQDDIFSKSSIPYSSLSRSVPSTPLPHHLPNNHHCSATNQSSNLASNGFSSKSLFELPKSVPSTPSIVNGRSAADSLFQYSPETSRDYLINGNSVERSTSSAGKLTSFYQNQSTISNGGTATTTSQSTNGAGPTTIPSGPSSASGGGPEMSILSDGIDSFTDALIGSDPLRFL